jgi:inhibitor of cysteine peptidase
MRSSLFAVCLLLTLALASGVGQQTSAVSHPKTVDSVVLTDRDNGTDVDLAANQLLIVKLNSNPSTGYAWSIVGDPSPLKLQKTSFRKNTSRSGAVGNSGISTFQLSAGAAGMATVTFVYRRSWEYNMPPMKTFTVRVNVR